MSDSPTPTVPEVTPAAAAPAAEPTMEQQLDALQASAKQPTIADTPAPETPAEPVVETPAEPTLESLLAEIEQPTPADDKAKPALSADQQRILEAVPTPQALEQLTTTLNGYLNFTAAFASGDHENVEAMFEAWNPAQTEQLREHFYKKYVESGQWVDRWIAEKEGNPTVTKGLTAMEQKIQRLEQQLQQRSATEQQQQSQAQLQRIHNGYTAHVEALFDRAKFSQADRPWVRSEINNRATVDPTVRQAINSGNFAAVNQIFVKTVREYSERDKALADGRAAQLASQEVKKPLLPTNPAPLANALPSDVRQVPKGKEDAWMAQELDNLAAKRRR